MQLSWQSDGKESLQGTWCWRLLGSRIQRLRWKRGLSRWKGQKEQCLGGTENLGCVWRRTWSELDGTELHVEGGLDSKESAFNAGDPGLIPGSGRSPREWNGSPLQYSCLESSMDRGAWWVTVHGWQRVRHNWATNMNSKLRSYGIKNWTDRQDRNSQGLEGGLRRLLFTPQAAESHRGLLSNYLIDLHSLSTVTEAKGKSVV